MKENTKNTIILLLFMVIVIGALAWLSRNDDAPQPAAINNQNGILTAKETTYDFGSISMARGLVNYEFTIENPSGDSVRIGEVSTSCMCTTAELRINDKIAGPFGMPGHNLIKKANLEVKPSEKLIVKAVFDPAAHGPAGVGPVEREIYIDTGAKEPMVLSFKAIVTP